MKNTATLNVIATKDSSEILRIKDCERCERTRRRKKNKLNELSNTSPVCASVLEMTSFFVAGLSVKVDQAFLKKKLIVTKMSKC
jgi:hypothetical protein